MKILSNTEMLNNPNGRTPIELECENCKKSFFRIKYDIEYAKQKSLEGDNSRGSLSYCSPSCAGMAKSLNKLKKQIPELEIISLEKLPNERMSVKYKCVCGSVVKQRTQDVKKKPKKCEECSTKQNDLSLFVQYQEIKEKVELKNLILKTSFGDFCNDKRSVRKINVECNHGHGSSRVIYKAENECWKCSIGGENSNFYKDGKCKSRIVPRISLANWKKEVFRIFGKRCFVCESERFIQAHHILPYISFPAQRENPYNGMPLCKNCHKEMHIFSGGYRKYDVMKFLTYIKNKAPEKYKKYILDQDFFSNKWFDNRWTKLWLLFKML